MQYVWCCLTLKNKQPAHCAISISPSPLPCGKPLPRLRRLPQQQPTFGVVCGWAAPSFVPDSPKIYNENVVDLLSDAATGGRQSPARKTSPRGRQGSNSVSPAVSPGVSPTGNGNGRGGEGGVLLKPTIRENKVKRRFFLP